MSCYVSWDRLRVGRKSFSLCGELVAERDISNEPTCPACRLELSLTVEDVFGAATPGTQVTMPPFDVFAGYTPKGKK